MSDKYLAEIQGGEGPDVWGHERTISAVDIVDAAKQAMGIAEDEGGQVIAVSQSDEIWKPPTENV